MPEFGTNFEMLVELDRAAPDALHRQLVAQFRERIRDGRLAAGTALPSTRALAADLKLSRGVVVEAYQQLVAEGYLVSRSGSYTRVSGVASRIAPSPRERVAAPPLRIDFAYGRPDVSQFPRAGWLRAMRRVLNELPQDRLLYLDGRGAPELREALAHYLNRVRGAAARPEHIVVTSGFAQGIRLLLSVLAGDGLRTLAVEDPSADDDVRLIAPALGVRLAGIPVGDDGIDLDALEHARPGAVLVTPSHQFPTGAVLASRERERLLDLGALVIEDDYDAEFRYDRDAIGAIQGLAPDRVVYAGTVSKTLAPGLRIGWLVLPPRLVEPVAQAKLLDDRGSPVLDQLALGDLIARGEYDRHLRRMRPRYRRRRDALLAALAREAPELEPTGVSAGLHLVAWLPDGVSEEAVVSAAAERGVGAYGLGPYRLEHAGRPGLLFGYGNLDERAIAEGVRLLAEALRAAAAR